MKIGRIPILDVSPSLYGGRWPSPAVVGETVTFSATVFREGHDAVNAEVSLTTPSGATLPPVRLTEINHGLAQWQAEVTFTEPGVWTFTVDGWADPVATWRHNVEVKLAAGQDIGLELAEGALLLERAAKGMKAPAAKAVKAAAKALRAAEGTDEQRLQPALSDEVTALLDLFPVRDLLTSSPVHEVYVDRERALF